MTKENDQILSEFFQGMKDSDRLKDTPNVDLKNLSRISPKKRRKLIGIAASIVLLLGVLLFRNQAVDVPPERSLLEIEQDIESIMSWKSGTSNLIEQ